MRGRYFLWLLFIFSVHRLKYEARRAAKLNQKESLSVECQTGGLSDKEESLEAVLDTEYKTNIEAVQSCELKTCSTPDPKV
jgi:hypothetical protein